MKSLASLRSAGLLFLISVPPCCASANTLPQGESPNLPVSVAAFHFLALKSGDSQPSVTSLLDLQVPSVEYSLWRSVMLTTSSLPTRPATPPSFHALTAITFAPGFRCFLTSVLCALFHSLPTKTFLPLINASNPLSHDIVRLADLVSLLMRIVLRKKAFSPLAAFLELQIHLGAFAVALMQITAKSPVVSRGLIRLLREKYGRNDIAGNIMSFYLKLQ